MKIKSLSSFAKVAVLSIAIMFSAQQKSYAAQVTGYGIGIGLIGAGFFVYGAANNDKFYTICGLSEAGLGLLLMLSGMSTDDMKAEAPTNKTEALARKQEKSTFRSFAEHSVIGFDPVKKAGVMGFRTSF